MTLNVFVNIPIQSMIQLQKNVQEECVDAMFDFQALILVPVGVNSGSIKQSSKQEKKELLKEKLLMN